MRPSGKAKPVKKNLFLEYFLLLILLFFIKKYNDNISDELDKRR